MLGVLPIGQAKGGKVEENLDKDFNIVKYDGDGVRNRIR
jgi:hypothetical protein